MDQELKDRLGKLSPEKRQLVLKKLREQQASAAAENSVDLASQVIELADRSKAIPLSYAQQRLWLLHQIDGHSAQYNEFSAQHISGSLNIEALKVAIDCLIERHEVLRTCFSSLDGVPYQKFGGAEQLFFQCTDFSVEDDALDSDEKLNQLATLAEEESLFPFDLEFGPLVRVHIYKLSDEQTVLFINMHHIICDGWSTAVFVTELLSLYQGAIDKKNVQLKPLRIQYADFAVWEREHLKSNT
ncbi:MAG: hypothetical protein ACJAY7_001272, partial [Pseudohongiellaceae bacterium]